MAAPVGSKKALTSKESGGERFPHMYGGIPPKGVVIKEYVVQRSAGRTVMEFKRKLDTGDASDASLRCRLSGT